MRVFGSGLVAAAAFEVYASGVDLTYSFTKALPVEIRERYEIREVRNAAALLAATNPDEFAEVVAVLRDFRLSRDDVLGAGGNKSDVARRLDLAFRDLGWREARHDTRVTSVLQLQPWPPGEGVAVVEESEVRNEGYKVDNVKGRVALDVEWNAKDGNLDRDLAAYRALYEAAIIDVGVIITRTQADLRAAVLELDPDSSKFSTTTTTNLEKLEPRLTRGDSGGCPVLAIAISSRCIDFTLDGEAQ